MKNIPRRVILNKEERKQLSREAHNESGHRGRDPTYKKLLDFYFWPNMLAEIAILYCYDHRRGHASQRPVNGS
jgi:hypothetical protein